MIKLVPAIFAICLLTETNAQNLYPKKLDNCITSHFCLDCGDIKANLDQEKFDKLISNLETTNKLKGIQGKILFQVLVDSLGKGCVLSHTDVSNNIISRNIVESLNNFDGFMPAKTNGKNEQRTSFDISFEIKEGKINAKVERVDMNAFKASFDHPNSPEIYNKEYVYKNENLKNYKFSVWNTKNSNLPNNMNDHIAIDKNGIIWLTIDAGLVNFDGAKFTKIEQNILDNDKNFDYYTIATDNSNRKWVYGSKILLSFDDKDWVKYDSQITGINTVDEIINNEKTDEIFFCSKKGLVIFKNGQWSSIDKEKLPDLPSNDVSFARRDSKNRIWIGTFSGSVMIDETGTTTNFNASGTPLKNKCITSLDEDEQGNLYFGLYEFGANHGAVVNRNEGIAIRYANGEWKQCTTSNSGMPFNHTTKVLYDKNQKVLWIATDRAGLVRFDLKDGWENYHSDNSQIPTSYISDMTFDSKGNLYLATRQGLVKMERK